MGVNLFGIRRGLRGMTAVADRAGARALARRSALRAGGMARGRLASPPSCWECCLAGPFRVLTAPWWVLAAWALALVGLVLVLAAAWRREATLGASSLRPPPRTGRRMAARRALALPIRRGGKPARPYSDSRRRGPRHLAERGAAAALPWRARYDSDSSRASGALGLERSFWSGGPLGGAAAALWHRARRGRPPGAGPAPGRSCPGRSRRHRPAEVEAAGRQHVTLWTPHAG